MSDRDELEAEVDRKKDRYWAHLKTCPICAAAVKAQVYMFEFEGCPVLQEVLEDADQAERRLIARNARACGDLTHARRVEWVIAQVEDKRRRQTDA
jgi:hypothetical protein